MAAIDWTNIYKKYKGFWVALMDDEVTVISSGKSLEGTSQKAEKKGFKDPIFYFVPKKLTYFVGEVTNNTKIVFADLSDKKALLGQYGFFDRFAVKFNLKREEIEIKSII